MTKAETEKIITIMGGADGGCIYCVKSLINEFMEEFPNLCTKKEAAKWASIKAWAYSPEDILKELEE